VRRSLTLWLLVLAVAQAAAVLAVRHFAVFTEYGQRLDWLALSGNYIGARHIDQLVHTVLDALGVASIAAATLVIGFIALIRRRFRLAVAATALVGGANVTAQLLKHVTVRPDLGVDLERVAAGNSFPSGHTALAASVAVALVLVLPARIRALGAVLAAAYAALAGVATMSAGWHRPSDAVAALLIVGAWAAAAGAFLVAGPEPEGQSPGRSHWFTSFLLLAATALATAFVLTAVQVASRAGVTTPQDLSRNALLTVYAGGAAAIAGTSALVMALLLTTLHRVVPRRDSRHPAPGQVPHRLAEPV
jgi:membrane-associated phospholipid phosphatase